MNMLEEFELRMVVTGSRVNSLLDVQRNKQANPMFKPGTRPSISFERLFLFCCAVDVVQKLCASLLLRFRISINAFWL